MPPTPVQLACPVCRGPVDEHVCVGCGRPLPLRDGWWLDAVGDTAIDDATRSRFGAYERPLVARFYDLDVRATSRIVWGASVAAQADFAAEALWWASSAGRAFLDVPGGSGIVIARALRQMSPDEVPPIVVADLSVQMLARTRSRLGDAATYVRADVTRLPFVDGAFGSVHSGNGFHLFPDTGVAATELGRVVGEGGAAAVATWVANDRRFAEAWMGRLARSGVINPPMDREIVVSALEGAGLRTSGSTVRGSLLMWRGVRSR